MDAIGEGVVAEGGGEVGFADAGGTDEDEVGGGFEESGVEVVEEFIAGGFWVEGPVEVGEELDAFDAGLIHEVLDALGLSFLIFGGEEVVKEWAELRGEGVGIGEGGGRPSRGQRSSS